jgi:hypothetical protein
VEPEGVVPYQDVAIPKPTTTAGAERVEPKLIDEGWVLSRIVTGLETMSGVATFSVQPIQPPRFQGTSNVIGQWILVSNERPTQ